MKAHEFNKGGDGLVTIQSQFGPKETMDRLEAAARAQGMRIFARINHAALATEVGQSLQPTELLIFGNLRAGTPLMQANQTMGIDLPLKALVWLDATGGTWLTYNEPELLARRHSVGAGTEQVVGLMSLSLAVLAKKATEQVWKDNARLNS
jgi:uncharacterized protein (DUF302 family)